MTTNSGPAPAARGPAQRIALGGGDRPRIGQGADVPPPRRPDRELAAWGAAVVHLRARGLPAAVPPFPAAWLRRRGIRADWVAAS